METRTGAESDADSQHTRVHDGSSGHLACFGSGPLRYPTPVDQSSRLGDYCGTCDAADGDADDGFASAGCVGGDAAGAGDAVVAAGAVAVAACVMRLLWLVWAWSSKRQRKQARVSNSTGLRGGRSFEATLWRHATGARARWM